MEVVRTINITFKTLMLSVNSSTVSKTVRYSRRFGYVEDRALCIRMSKLLCKLYIYFGFNSRYLSFVYSQDVDSSLS